MQSPFFLKTLSQFITVFAFFVAFCHQPSFAGEDADLQQPSIFCYRLRTIYPELTSALDQAVNSTEAPMSKELSWKIYVESKKAHAIGTSDNLRDLSLLAQELYAATPPEFHIRLDDEAHITLRTGTHENRFLATAAIGNIIRGTPNNDELHISDRATIIFCGAGDDIVYCDGKADSFIIGGAGNDVFHPRAKQYGTIIWGGEGDDAYYFGSDCVRFFILEENSPNAGVNGLYLDEGIVIDDLSIKLIGGTSIDIRLTESSEIYPSYVSIDDFFKPGATSPIRVLTTSEVREFPPIQFIEDFTGRRVGVEYIVDQVNRNHKKELENQEHRRVQHVQLRKR